MIGTSGGRLPVDAVGAGTFGKPLLVELSHAVERFALATDVGGAAAVVGMFQKAAYFRPQAEVYRAIAATGAVTVVGFVADVPPPLPAGVRHVLLEDGDDLVKEWSVTALWPYGGATLVAADLQALEPGAPTLEEGRTFRAGWSFRREEARRQVLRLRATLPLDPATSADLDGIVRAVATTPEPVHQAPWNEALRFLADRLHGGIRDRAALAARLEAVADPGERDRRAGFDTEASVHHWIAGSSGAAPPIGLVLVQLVGLAGLRARYGRRAELAVLGTVRTAPGDLIGDGHRVAAQGPEELLVVLTATATPDDVLRLCNELAGLSSRLGTTYPFVALPVKVAGAVTRSRPLPVARLRQHAVAGQRSELVAD
jgi:DICT domain-containing protein